MPRFVPRSFRAQGAKQATPFVPGFPSVPVNTNTPSADSAEAPPAAAPVRLSWKHPRIPETSRILDRLASLTTRGSIRTLPLAEKGRLKFLCPV